MSLELNGEAFEIAKEVHTLAGLTQKDPVRRGANAPGRRGGESRGLAHGDSLLAERVLASDDILERDPAIDIAGPTTRPQESF